MVPMRLRLFVSAVTAAGLGTLGASAIADPEPGLQRPLVILAFVAILAVSWAFPLLMFRKQETEALHLDEALLVAMAALLPPLEVVATFALGVGIGQLARRRGWLRTLFNTGQSVTAAGAAVWTMHALAPVTGQVSPRVLLALVVGAAIFLILQNAAVSGVIALAEGRQFKAALLDGAGIRWVIWMGNVSAGLLAGLVAKSFPWALTFVVVPVAVLQVAFAGHLRARRDRERMDGLFSAALTIHAPMRPEEVESSIIENARNLLRCESARIDEKAPADAELGSVLRTNAGEKWLTVFGRRGFEPFTEADENLLKAIAAIGAAALDKAASYREAREERKKLSDVVGSSSDGIFSVGNDGKLTSWNQAMSKITGHSAAEMLGTRHLGTLRPRHPDGNDILTDAWIEADSGPADIQIMTNGGETRWLNCTFSPMQDGGYVAVARDITAQREVDQLKIDFLATISHELRTPLTPIQGFLQTLLRKDAEFSAEQRTDFYKTMLGQSERLSRLVAELLDSVTLQGRQQIFLSDSIDWAESVRSIVDLFRQQHPERDFQLDIAQDLPRAVGDEQRALQVLTNLLNNAVKYASPDSPLRIILESMDTQVVTTISDAGPGIPEDHREKIFERFTRLGDHLTRATGGVGLGLFICRRLVESMGGTIWMEPSKEGGSAFKFTMPTYDASSQGFETEISRRDGWF